VLRGLQEQADPFDGFAKDQRGELAVENAAAQGFAIDNGGKDASHEVGFGIESTEDFELGEGLGPVSEDGMKLEEEDAEFRVFRMRADLVLQFGQGGIGLAGGEVLLGGHGSIF